MKRNSYLFMVCFVVAQIFFSCKNENIKDPVDYVNPNIGTIGHLLVATEAMVQLPHGMVQTGQNPYPEIGDRYLADKISSFSLRALPRYGIKTVPSWIMATTGKARVNTGEIASTFDHDFETVTPYFSSVILEDYQITVETTVTEHASFYQFSFPKSDESYILLGNNSKIKIIGNNAIEAVENIGKGQKAYFYAEFSKPFSSVSTWKGISISVQSEQLGDSIGALASFSTAEGEKVGVKVGVSYINIEQAKQNLINEIPDWNFDQT